MSGTKYWRTVVQVEVLSEGEAPPECGSLENLAYATREGDCSGAWDQESEEVPKEKMAELLLAQGSDPEFLLGEDEDNGVGAGDGEEGDATE